MPFTTNIKAFSTTVGADALVNAYLALVGVELALKDAGHGALGGHDVPTRLQSAASAASVAHPFLAAQLNGHAAKLANDLKTITCVGRNGNTQTVPPGSYPFLRYARLSGDWGAIDETPAGHIKSLEATCKALRTFLQNHRALLGVHI